MALTIDGNFTCASVKSLLEIKDVCEDTAKLVRGVWRAATWDELRLAYGPEAVEEAKSQYYAIGFRHLKRHIVDKLIGTCGVEHLGMHKRANQHVYYCNGGDTYATTVLFIGRRLVVGCWGDLAERNLIEEKETSW